MHSTDYEISSSEGSDDELPEFNSTLSDQKGKSPAPKELQERLSRAFESLVPQDTGMKGDTTK